METEGKGKKIRIGTRESKLSVAQTMLVADAMKAACPGLEIELVCQKTKGDRILDRPLPAFGGKGVFVSEFEEGILKGELDFAVHSAKDLPIKLADGLEIIGAPLRGDPRDVLVSLAGSGWEGRSGPVRIGTSSLRRKIQMETLGEKMWPGRRVVCENLRGNVLTRLEKLEQGAFDGIILAAAGIDRLNLPAKRKGKYRYHYFSTDEMIPAGGQGILVIEGKAENPQNRIARAVSHEETMERLRAERAVLRLLNAGCHEPIGVFCRMDREEDKLFLSGIYEKGGVRRLYEAAAPRKEWERLAKEMAVGLAGAEGESR